MGRPRSISRPLRLWLLANIGALDPAAADLFRKYGPTNKRPTANQFVTPPDENTWRRELAGQTRLQITAGEALDNVRNAWQKIQNT